MTVADVIEEHAGGGHEITGIVLGTHRPQECTPGRLTDWQTARTVLARHTNGDTTTPAFLAWTTTQVIFATADMFDRVEVAAIPRNPVSALPTRCIA